MTPTRNNPGIAHENGAIEGPHGHLKRAIEDALLMRGSADFDDLAAYRRFIDEIVGRRNARNAKRIDIERAELQHLPDRRTSDYEEVIVRVTSSGGFTLRKVFYTVPSRLIGHRLRVRLYDDRLDIFIGGTHLMTLPRGRASSIGQARPGRRLSPCHPFAAPQADGAAQPRLSRPALPARGLSADLRRAPAERLPERQACRIMVDLLALAHERGCEGELADQLAAALQARQLPDMAALRARFAPDPARLPQRRRAPRSAQRLRGPDRRQPDGRRGMKTNNAVDTARLSLLLNELRLPAIKLHLAAASPSRPTRKAGPPPASSPPSPSTNSPSATAAASSAISPRPACRPERPSTPSTSRPCR